MNKKLYFITICSVLGLLVSMFAFNTPSYAQTQSKVNVIYEAKEIKDVNKLLARAKKGVTDDTSLEKQNNEIVNLKGSKATKSLKTYNTSQLIKKVEKENGEIVETYAYTTITPLTSEDFAATADGNKYDSKYGESYGVQAYSTFYYETQDVNGNVHIDLTSANGGWNIDDSGLSISDQRVNVGQTGPSRLGSGYSNDPITIYPSSTSWSYSGYRNWVPIDTTSGDSYYSVGTTSWVDISGYGDTWSLMHTNHY
jgi:hypothetical protein